MLKKLELLRVYTKDYSVLAIGLTAVFLYLLIINELSAITILIWMKIISSLIGLYIHKNRKRKEVFFYLNNGIGEKWLLFSTLFFDMLFFVIGLFLIIKFIR